MTLYEELQRDADLAKDQGGMYYSGQYLQGYAYRARLMEAENAKLRELMDELWALAYGYAPHESELDTARDMMRELGIEVE